MSHHDDRDLRELLHDTVDVIEPHDRLQAIRNRTRESAKPAGARPWLLGTVGAVVATAAAVAAVAVVRGDLGGSADPQPGGTPSATSAPSVPAPSEPTPSEPTQSPGSTPAGTVAVPVYYAGETPLGTRLYREFRRVDSGSRLTAAAALAMSGDPVDPDYRSLWPDGSVVDSVRFDAGEIVVDLADDSLVDRPGSVTASEAGLALEQVIYTLQGVVGERAPVRFTLDGDPAPTVLGVPTAEPLANAPQLDVLSLVNLTAPEQDAGVTGDRLVVSGVASSFEATVPLQVLRGGQVVLEGFATAAGWQDRLYPFETTLDVSGLPPGDYTLRASTDDPSAGEGPGPMTDTKAFTLS
jgi:hypothetical protein